MTLALFGLMTAQAQRTPDLGFGLQVGAPAGSYEAVYGGAPVGLGINASFPLSRWHYLPVEVGVDMGFNSMGMSANNTAFIDEYGNNLTHRMEIRSSYNAYHMQARFKPFNGRIKPYGDLLIGAKAHKTVLENSLDDGFSEFGQQVDVLQRDWTASYGWAAGMQIKLGKYSNLDFKLQKLHGGAATFVDQNSVVIKPDGAYTFDTKTSPQTNLYVGQVGLTFSF